MKVPYGEVLYAWHDVVCPEGDECRSRSMHAFAYDSMPLRPFLGRLGIEVE